MCLLWLTEHHNVNRTARSHITLRGLTMGRKKSKGVGEPAAEQTNGKDKGPTLAGAIQTALNTLGVEAETAKIRDWVQKNYPTLDVNAPSFQSTLSIKRKK